MSQIDQILSQLPLADIAQQVGASQADVEQAAQTIVPSLVGGMQANAQDPGGAQSLYNALGQHQDSPADAQSVDTADGERIVQHVFGDNTDQVVNQLGGLGSGGASNDLVKKLLPILAPIVISYLSKRILGQQGAGNTGGSGGTNGTGGSGGTGGLGDILGQILGGGSSGTSASGLPGGLGDILGGLLGAGRKS